MSSEEIMSKSERTEKTKSLLRWAALFLGELRDGLTMVRTSAPRPLKSDVHMLLL